MLSKVRLRAAGALLAAAAAVSSALAATPTPYWIAPRSNVTLDAQVAQDIGRKAGVVIVRASWQHPEPAYTMASIAKRLKAGGSAPVLAYAWSNRHAAIGRSEVDLFRGMDLGTPVATLEESGVGRVSFLDVRQPAMRNRIVERFVDAKRQLGVDGFALDLSQRTPNRGPMGRVCRQEPGFCESYAVGMDALFGDLRRSLGADTFIAFNGLFNYLPGQIDDQARLLQNTNAAAIEYFGMDPNEEKHFFSKDILPYLRAVERLPADRAVMFFGRGPWRYSDYTEDFRWQRYLYASFLLAARQRDMFKYHSSFQVPAHEGRTGGLDRFADWNLELGAPRGAASGRDGLWVREFAAGLVAVAPDDGSGGTLRLPRAMYTPEGAKLEGSVKLEPGTAQILLDTVRPETQRPSRRVIAAATMGGWGWKAATPASRDGKRMLQLAELPGEMTGEHDVLLDGERSLTPYTRLEIDLGTVSAQGAIQVVAEVDDRRKQHMLVVIDLGAAAPPEGTARTGPALPFRSTPAKGRNDTWPWISGGKAQSGAKVSLEGPQFFEGTGYRFRRWSHVRFTGPLTVGDIELFKPRAPLRVDSEP